MINKNQILNPFLSNEFVHIEDVIVLDEPILSHYRRNENDYFLYLVDKEKSFDKYLLLKIDEWTICEYFIGNISLLEVINSTSDFIHILDIDFDGELIKNETTNVKYINENFLPNLDSKILFKPLENSLYYNIIEEHKNNQYVNDLKKDAFYIKISPKSSKYGHTVGLKDISETIFKKITQSYYAFSKADFKNTFEKKYTDLKQLTKNFSLVNDETDFRIVDAEIHSFEIGLAVDKKMKMSIENVELRNWSIDIGEEFRNIVLDTDYNNPEKVDSLLDKFSPEQRREIFTPIFEIIDNKNIQFQVKKEKKSKYRNLKIKDKYTIEKIIPKEIKILPNEINDLELIQITALVEKGKDLKSIKIDNNTLFSSTDNTDFILKYDDFVKHGYEKIDKTIQIKLNIITNQGTVSFEAIYDNLTFNESINSEKLDDGLTKIIAKIYEYFLNKE